MPVDLAQLARHSRLHIPPEDFTRLEGEIDSLVRLVSRLPAAEPGACAGAGEDMPTPLRADSAGPSLPRGELLQNAPRAEQGCFWVPKTVDTEG